VLCRKKALPIVLAIIFCLQLPLSQVFSRRSMHDARPHHRSRSAILTAYNAACKVRPPAKSQSACHRIAQGDIKCPEMLVTTRKCGKHKKRVYQIVTQSPMV